MLALLVVLLVLRLSERPTKLDAALLGLVVGAGLWQTAQLLPIALVATAWLLWRRPATLRLAPLALACALLAFLPWIVSNLRHDWWSFSFPPGYGTFSSRLRGTVNGALPMALNLRVPFDLGWVGGVAIGGVAMLALYAGFVTCAVRTRKTSVGLLVVLAVVFPLLAATSTFTWIVDEPRYLYILSPIFALLVSVVLTSWQRTAIAVALATMLTIFGLAKMNDSPLFEARADGMFVPSDFRPLEAELSRLRVDPVLRTTGLPTGSISLRTSGSLRPSHLRSAMREPAERSSCRQRSRSLLALSLPGGERRPTRPRRHPGQRR